MTLNRRGLRLGAALGAAALSSLAIAPAFAATTVSQATASAINLSIGGQSAYSGKTTATNDGTEETKTGVAQPPISVLGNQGLLNVGVLTQESTAQVSGNAGVSAACAGVAGNGGSTSPLANVGDSSCITPGEPVGISIANLDLSGVVVIDPASALGPLAEANPVLEQILSAITQPLSEAIGETPLGDLALGGSFGAVEAICQARPGTASGDANIVDTNGGDDSTPITLTLPGQEPVVLANLDAHPAPNTHIPVNLDDATEAILGAVQTELETALAEAGTTGPLAPLAALPEALQTQVIEALVDATRDQLLQPLQDNILDITLNKQVPFPATDRIDVTALDLQLLPAAKQFAGDSLVSLQLAEVTCGPNSTLAPAANPSPSPEPAPQPGPDKGTPTLPTSVDSGAGGNSNTGVILGATGALLLVAGATGLLGYRRLLQK
ncbi:MAG TPA: hypothetical protein VFK34_11925 [Marmoricola sp.]|nr:hypothetical protein [Marmoricola sp.]